MGMSDGVRDGGIDAAAVGLALAYPERLREEMAGLAADWGAVDEAAGAVSAGLVELGRVTAGLNGSVAVARPAGAGRVPAGPTGNDAGFEDGGLLRAAVSGVEAEYPGRRGDRGSETGVRDGAPGVAPVVVAATRAEERPGGPPADVQGRDAGNQAVTLGSGFESAAPVEAGVRSGPAEGMAVVDSGPGASVGQAAAPVVERVVLQSGGRREGGTVGFGDAGGQVVGGMMGPGVAPVSGRLRADVGAALQGRAAVRGIGSAEATQIGEESAAFVRGQGRDRGGDGGTGLGFGEASGRPGPEATWAPQPAGRGGGGSGEQRMGVVQLDGRLVGHWLSESMAREAGRPGAGTTFFDPRQGPAWTPSGAL